MIKDVADLIEGLESTTCRCGRRKRPMHSLCGSCYRRLPTLLREALYRRIGSGYAEAYANAEAFLEPRGLPD